MEIIGREIEAGYAVESSRGTAETTAEHWQKNVTASIIPRAEKVVDDATRGRFEDADQTRLVRKWYEGDLEGIVHADAIGYLFYNLYGSVTSSVVTSPVHSHTFTLGQSAEHPSITIFAKDGGVVQEVLSNGMVNTLELTASTDDYMRFTSNLFAKDASSNSDTPSYSTEYDFIGRDISVKIADTSAGLSGATAVGAKNLSVTWNQGLIPNYVFGANTPADIHNSMMSIEGTLTLDFTDSTFRDLWQADTSKYMEVKVQGAADIGSGNNPTITLTLNKMQVTDWNRSGGNNELVTQEVSFRGFYNASDSKQSEVVLQNLTTEYDTP